MRTRTHVRNAKSLHWRGTKFVRGLKSTKWVGEGRRGLQGGGTTMRSTPPQGSYVYAVSSAHRGLVESGLEFKLPNPHVKNKRLVRI